MMVGPREIRLIVAVQSDYDILEGDPTLMAGWVQVESAWDENATRFEPRFLEKYLLPKYPELPDTELMLRATSWGLLQVMGQVAREHGFTGRYLDLLDPATNLELAARILKLRYAITRTWQGALAAYNGGLGGNARAPYRNQAYVDRVEAAARQYGYEGGVL